VGEKFKETEVVEKFSETGVQEKFIETGVQEEFIDRGREALEAEVRSLEILCEGALQYHCDLVEENILNEGAVEEDDIAKEEAEENIVKKEAVDDTVKQEAVDTIVIIATGKYTGLALTELERLEAEKAAEKERLQEEFDKFKAQLCSASAW